ncbi:MAG: hypothetical protein EA343_08755 [Nodularia sp. (in: Bacteria)]|nr:MAG: hypothetical protein EA343_08755 [Nodularia sp. (in: cyanobacteria)]
MAENNIQGNGNWYYTDGQWISDEGADLSVADAFASGNPPDGYIPDTIPDDTGSGDTSGGNLFGGGDSSGGSPFGGGDGSGGSPFGGGDGSVDSNNPFGQLLDIISLDSDSSDSGSNVFGGGNNPPENLPIGSTPASSTSEIANTGNGNGNGFGGGNDLAGNPGNESFLPDAPEGLSVPYNSDDWISDLKDLESGEPDASVEGNTGNGNGNWFYGSNNTADGNGNWYFGNNNTTDGNGNWSFGEQNTTDGNGNWEFGSNNSSDGNGNWQLGDHNSTNGNGNISSGDHNTTNGNSNIVSGDGNNILGNANTSNINDGGLLGNNIQTSDDGRAYIGNEDWSFDILDELTSLGSGTSGIGDDVRSLLNHPDLISSSTSKEGYSNSNYVFDFSGL